VSRERSSLPSPTVPVGYWALLRENPRYRRLWMGLVVSMAGDWFRTIALYLLVLRLTGASGLALGGVVIAETLSIFVMSPLAGVAADRFSRKAIMIIADLVRAVLALGFLLITSAERVWLAYVLSAVLMGVSAFFNPAHAATIPNLTTRRQLLTANALASATWASMLAIGSALGGVVAAAMGAHAAFVIDAATYVVSACCIATVPIPARQPDASEAGGTKQTSSWQDFWQGLRYIVARPRVVWLISVKACGVGVGGGMILLFALFAENVFQAGATGLGMLYMTRGLGAVVGPILARRLAGEEAPGMSRAIGVAFLITGGFYMVFAHMPTLLWGAGALFVAYMAASVLWVFSSTLLQISVPDVYRGRVLAADFALFTVMMAASTFVTGWGLDDLAVAPRTAATLLGSLLLLPGVLWLSPVSPSGAVLVSAAAREVPEQPP
jgi:predicted MFS family arabinose efflux permease